MHVHEWVAAVPLAQVGCHGHYMNIVEPPVEVHPDFGGVHFSLCVD